MKLHGFDTVLRNLNTEIKKIKKRNTRGLLSALIELQRDMEPMIPLDEGNLRASFFITTKIPSGVESADFRGKNASELQTHHSAVVSQFRAQVQGEPEPTAIFGFTAFYAWYVHEMIGATFQRPNAEAKFMEKAIDRKINGMLKIIAEESKI